MAQSITSLSFADAISALRGKVYDQLGRNKIAQLFVDVEAAILELQAISFKPYTQRRSIINQAANGAGTLALTFEIKDFEYLPSGDNTFQAPDNRYFLAPENGDYQAFVFASPDNAAIQANTVLVAIKATNVGGIGPTELDIASIVVSAPKAEGGNALTVGATLNKGDAFRFELRSMVANSTYTGSATGLYALVKKL